MDPAGVFFYVFGGLAIGFALLTVLKRNPVASAFSLVMVFFCFAGIYALLDAHLIAGLQILVYAGAVMVLFVFVIMLLNADIPSFDLAKSGWPTGLLAAAGSAALFGLFTFAFRRSALPSGTGAFTPERVKELGGNTQVISELMFSDYILPFELTSVLLLGAIVGAVAIAKRKVGGPSNKGPGGCDLGVAGGPGAGR